MKRPQADVAPPIAERFVDDFRALRETAARLGNRAYRCAVLARLAAEVEQARAPEPSPTATTLVEVARGELGLCAGELAALAASLQEVVRELEGRGGSGDHA